MTSVIDVGLGADSSCAVTANPLLFDVLDELDRMDEDADVTFILTTNRTDVPEPALAARPGRVDSGFPMPS